MRTVVLLAVSALVLAGCDQIKNHFAKPAAPPPAPAAAQPAPATPPLPAASAPTPESPPGGAVSPEKAAGPPPAAPPQVVRWSPADYAKRERRLAALIANAETRDGSGQTQSRAEEGRYRRAHCATRACIESSYASEEAWLKQWEGSGDVK